MTVLGIDPGFERIGYGAVAREGSRLALIEHGLITTLKGPLPDRLLQLHEQVGGLIERIRPDALAIERLLFSVNRKTALDVAKALGCILLAGSQRGYLWAEYAPSEIKLAVVGNGAAEKKQVEYMVMKLLGLHDAPKPDDVADALAIALCHALRGEAFKR
ncbi:MAG: crossover junction endodeoxyribonuclease RuvC [Fimbriimonadaceae bacterium]